MTCLRCEEICRCPSESPEAMWGQPPPAVRSSEARQVLASAGTSEAVEESGSAALSWTPEGGCPDIDPPQEALQRPAAAEADAGDSAWRGEISERLSRYRARRKMPPPRYPSLTLQFDPGETRRAADPLPASSPVSFGTISDQALALDRLAQFSEEEDVAQSAPVGAPPAAEHAQAASTEQAGRSVAGRIAEAKVARAKILEFPRFAWGPPAPPPDQLAEPVGDELRILEVPEEAPPPPALGGITIEPAQAREIEKQPGIDIPLQSASLVRRVCASLVDGLIVAAASAFFGFIFWKIAAVRPPIVQILGLAAGIPCLFWAAYQYLMMVYAGRTLGLRAAGLELAFFNGNSPKRSVRRWRVLASYLSAASLGMGYAWVLLDEDSLCWHDRITHTYIAPSKPHP